MSNVNFKVNYFSANKSRNSYYTSFGNIYFFCKMMGVFICRRIIRCAYINTINGHTLINKPTIILTIYFYTIYRRSTLLLYLFLCSVRHHISGTERVLESRRRPTIDSLCNFTPSTLMRYKRVQLYFSLICLLNF